MKRIINTLMIILVAIMGISVCNGINVNATGEANPRLLVEKYWITDEEAITPGEEFELNLRIKNTSKYYDTYSVVVTVTDDSGNKIPYIYPIYGKSNQEYIERVYASNSWDISFKLTAQDNIDITAIPLKVTITYNDNYFVEKQSNSTAINIPIKADGDLKINSCSVPETVSLGAKARVSASYENTGINTIKNVVMNVEYGDERSIQNELYDVQGGSAPSTAEVYIDCDTTGKIPVIVSFTYENNDGDKYTTDKMKYNIIVEDDNNKGDVEIVGHRVDYTTFILLGAIVIVAIVILVILRRRRK